MNKLFITLALLIFSSSPFEIAAQNPTLTNVNRIAFGSCAKQWQTQIIWHQVITTQPDLCLFLGDAIYADTDGKTAWKVSEDQLAGEWNRLQINQSFRRHGTQFRCWQHGITMIKELMQEGLSSI